MMGHSMLLDQLDTKLGFSSGSKDLTYKTTKTLLADMSILDDCLKRLVAYGPLARSFEPEVKRRSKEMLKKRGVDIEPRVKILQLFRLDKPSMLIGYICDKDIVQDLVSIRKTFPYPIDKPRTKSNVKELRSAEWVLNNFWVKVDYEIDMLWIIDQQLNDKLSRFKKMAMIEDGALFTRTPYWDEPQEKVPHGSRAKFKQLLSIFKPSSNTNISQIGDSVGDQNPQTAAEKGLDTESVESEASKLLVDEKSFQILKMIFHDSETTRAHRRFLGMTSCTP